MKPEKYRTLSKDSDSSDSIDRMTDQDSIGSGFDSWKHSMGSDLPWSSLDRNHGVKKMIHLHDVLSTECE